jgi:hypothetical protein
MLRIRNVGFCVVMPCSLVGDKYVLKKHATYVLCFVDRVFLYMHVINLLRPTGYYMHQQFNIVQMYALPTLCLCVLYLSENKQRLVPLTA